MRFKEKRRRIVMKNKKNVVLLVVALVLCLTSMIGASQVQTSGGDVVIKDMRWETASGQLLSALILIPDTATEENPAPGIVTSHGWYNNREMQDLNYVEYARRGYVVISIDMYGHGHSDNVTAAEWRENGTGMYDAVKLMADLPYVDASRIGVTGHSNGARAANWSVLDDVANDEQLIASVLLVANDAMYTSAEEEPVFWMMQPAPDERDYVNRYGTRDVGIIAAHFDEFFFRQWTAPGVSTTPQEYIGTHAAQSFLYFGTNPEEELRESAKFYTQDVEGVEAVRVIYEPHQTHPWNHFSAECVEYGVEFFEKTLGAPNPIASTKQIWQWKVFFNVLGLAGFLMFLVLFAKYLLGFKFFEVLKAKEEVKIREPLKGLAKWWFWISLVAISAISYFSYLNIQEWMGKLEIVQPKWLPQAPVYFIGTWSAFMGVVVIIALVAAYFIFAKKQGLDLRERGVFMSWEKWGKTILLAVITVSAAFTIVFFADYFFKTDFRIWVLYAKAFEADKIWIALRYLPFFLLFYIPNSIAINVFNYHGKKEWLNTAILALFNGLSVIVVVILNYSIFFATGEQGLLGGISILGIWAIPVAIILPLAAIASRKIYRATNNPYIAGFINALVVVLVSCANTLTVVM